MENESRPIQNNGRRMGNEAGRMDDETGPIPNEAGRMDNATGLTWNTVGRMEATFAGVLATRVLILTPRGAIPGEGREHRSQGWAAAAH